MSISKHPRRLRRGKRIRALVQDVNLQLNNFIYPLFVRSGSNQSLEINSMPGVSQMTSDLAVEEIKRLAGSGVKNFILFGVIDRELKDATGSYALSAENPVMQTLKAVKSEGLDVLMIADLCYCEYTDHGHCGVLSSDPEQTIDNQKSLEIITKQGIALAEMGADILAPSGMLDGVVAALRTGLDGANFSALPIMSYSTKYSSDLYGPFRDAADGAPSFGDRKSYQMDFKRSNEWQLENQLDIQEGADMLMVKPASYYLDVIAGLRQQTNLPVGAYQVSGEYSMIHAAAQNDWLDLQGVALESLSCIKRAGADYIISYFTKDLPDWLKS